MKVVRNDKTMTTTFDELEVGQTYLDKDGTLCMKTLSAFSNSNNLGSCIFFNEELEKWESLPEKRDALCTPIESTLTIE